MVIQYSWLPLHHEAKKARQATLRKDDRDVQVCGSIKKHVQDSKHPPRCFKTIIMKWMNMRHGLSIFHKNCEDETVCRMTLVNLSQKARHLFRLHNNDNIGNMSFAWLRLTPSQPPKAVCASPPVSSVRKNCAIFVIEFFGCQRFI